MTTKNNHDKCSVLHFGNKNNNFENRPKLEEIN